MQALDLIGRKVMRDGGATLKYLVAQMREAEVDSTYQVQLEDAYERLLRVTDSVVARSQEDPHLPGAVSTEFLELTALTAYAWLWARMSQAAPADDFGAAKRATAEFFFARLLPKTVGLEESINASSNSLMALADELF